MDERPENGKPLLALLASAPPFRLQGHLLSPLKEGGILDIPEGLLAVDGLGQITWAGPQETAPILEGPLLDLGGGWILPGMVDLHTHLPQHGCVAADGLELLPWLESVVFPEEARFADLQVARRGAASFFRELLTWGTTTALVMGSVHASATEAAFQEAERCGIRAVIGQALMDRNVPRLLAQEAEPSLYEAEALCEAWHGRDHQRLQYAFTLRFAPACSPELMRGAGVLAQKYGAYLHTHLAESLAELTWVKELFPEASSYADVYRSHGLLGPHTLLAHGIHLDSDERRLLRETGSVLVHCPRSNAFLGSGIMPLRRWMEEGLRLGLGTDVGAGPSLSLWAEAAFACTTSKLLRAQARNLGLEDPGPALGPLEAWRLATLGGAQALGLEKRIGSLEVGKEGDFLVLDVDLVDPLPSRGPELPERVLSRLLYRERPGMVLATYVRGRRCH